MKKLIMLAAILISSVCISSAQEKTDKGHRERKTPKQRAQLLTNGLEKKLTLTADQKVKIYQINLERAKEMNEFEKGRTENRKKQMEARKLVMKDSDKKMTAVLTANQNKMYQELKAERKTKLKEHRNNRSSRN